MDDDERREIFSIEDGEGPNDAGLDEAPEPPAKMDDRAAYWWRRVLPQAVDADLLTRLDLPLFRAWCQLMSLAERFHAELEDGPTLAEGRSGPKKSPAWTQYKQAVSEARKTAHTLALTPQGRKAIGRTVADDAADLDPMEEAFGRGNDR